MLPQCMIETLLGHFGSRAHCRGRLTKGAVDVSLMKLVGQHAR